LAIYSFGAAAAWRCFTTARLPDAVRSAHPWVGYGHDSFLGRSRLGSVRTLGIVVRLELKKCAAHNLRRRRSVGNGRSVKARRGGVACPREPAIGSNRETSAGCEPPARLERGEKRSRTTRNALRRAHAEGRGNALPQTQFAFRRGENHVSAPKNARAAPRRPRAPPAIAPDGIHTRMGKHLAPSRSCSCVVRRR
jgi:hypothetical protein